MSSIFGFWISTISSHAFALIPNLVPQLTQPRPTFWPQKAQIRISFNLILVKKDRNHIIINFVTLRLSQVKFLTIISFLTFLTWMKSGKNLALMSIKCGILATFALIFYSGVFTTTTFCFKMYSPCKTSININNPKLEYSSSEKKLLKPLKITIFWPNLCKNGVPMSCTQNKEQFFLQ